MIATHESDESFNEIADMPKIITEHVYPPIPDRHFDWSAYRDGYDEGDIVGRGRTERAAIVELLEQEAEVEAEAIEDALGAYFALREPEAYRADEAGERARMFPSREA